MQGLGCENSASKSDLAIYNMGFGDGILDVAIERATGGFVDEKCAEAVDSSGFIQRLKILVSVVRFRPRPPNQIPVTSTAIHRRPKPQVNQRLGAFFMSARVQLLNAVEKLKRLEQSFPARIDPRTALPR